MKHKGIVDIGNSEENTDWIKWRNQQSELEIHRRLSPGESYASPTPSQVHIPAAMNQDEEPTPDSANYRESDNSAHSCATCDHYTEGLCDPFPAEPFADYDGVMVAFFLPQDVAMSLAVEQWDVPDNSTTIEPADMHVTLALLPGALAPEREADLLSVLEKFAAVSAPIRGDIGGLGLFATPTGDGRYPLYSNFDAPALPEFRQRLVDALEFLGGFEVAKDHGYTPHVTLAYVPGGYELQGSLDTVRTVTLDRIVLANGNQRTEIPLGEKGANDGEM